ncbi:MAG: cytochrome c [Magnetovibrio sp.]|nr:cytochrome c [Magnetovibrio sp.]
MSQKNKCLTKIAVLAFVMSTASAAFSAETVNVKMPKELTAQAQWGAMAFDTNCAACHGKNGSGTDSGPPLIHDTYNPGHHGDEAFYRAMNSGVQQHHWPYGNMPAQTQIKPDLAKKIVKFVREVQQENGIVFKPHRM